MITFEMLETARYRHVADQAIALAEQHGAVVKQAQALLRELPADSYDGLFYCPATQSFIATEAAADFAKHASAALADLGPVIAEPVPNTAEPLLPVLYGLTTKQAWRASRGWGHLTLANPNFISRNIPGGGSPLVSMLAGGLVGAGLGYGAGAIGEQVLPKKWERGKLRRTLAVLGGLGGAAIPGGFGVYTNATKGKWPWEPGAMFTEPVPPAVKTAYDNFTGSLGPRYIEQTGGAPAPVQELLDAVWKDPRVAGPLSPVQQAAFSGLVTGAAYDNGRRTRFITPVDMARMTAGMGSGYMSGALIGRALGALTGMPERTQNKLKTTGLYAGVIANLLPVAFGF